MRVGDLRELSCRETTKEMRAQMRQQAHQSPNAHRRVLGAYSLVVIHFFSSDDNAEILSSSKKSRVVFSFCLKSNRQISGCKLTK